MVLWRRLLLEAFGTGLLLAAVVGSGIMAERLSGGNAGVALLANAIATGAILFVLISMIGPLSGAHFNPAVSLVMMATRDLPPAEAIAYGIAQVAGGILGVWLAHGMFDLAILQQASQVRSGIGQNIAECAATFGLVTTILLTASQKPQAVAASVALYITSAYWFTASTSFANPAATIARSMTDTFAGIAWPGIGSFILFQMIGAMLATLFCAALGLVRISRDRAG